MRRLVWVLVAASAAFAADEAPAWLKDAAAAPPGTYNRKVPAVVLLDEGQVTVDASGQTVHRTRHAIRILNRDGRDYAVASQSYDKSGSKVKDFQAWLIRPNGTVIKYGKERVVDVAAVENDVYDEVRVRRLKAGDDAQDGAVFGYETALEEKSVFTQFRWGFQNTLPVVVSRYTLSLPAGWTAKSITYNRAPVEPAVSGSNYTWELRDLPFIDDEDYSPEYHAIVPRLAISYFPGPDNRGDLRGMGSWSDVSRFFGEIADPQMQIDSVITDRAKELTANAATELDKIRAIGQFAQKVNYVAIFTDLRRGGGYKPHLPRQVLDKQYGDCKDKANLMRTMLKAIGIPAYMVSIYSGDATYVHEDWPSPHQFNHAIVAVKISDSTQAAPVVVHPKLGRLLIFDPTDDDTPVGDLPHHLQGGFALIEAGGDGALLKMPTMPAEANRIETTVKGALTGTGRIDAVSDTGYFGQTGALVRGYISTRDNAQQRTLFEHWVTRTVGGASLLNFSHKDSRNEGRLDLHLEFNALYFGKSMQGRLLVIKPGSLPSRQGYALPPMEQRKLPLVLTAELHRDTVTLQIPDGFVVDELPDPVKLDSPYGKYEAVWKAEGKTVTFTQSLSVPSITAPPSEYNIARKFFERVSGAEESPVVLLRK